MCMWYHKLKMHLRDANIKKNYEFEFSHELNSKKRYSPKISLVC